LQPLIENSHIPHYEAVRVFLDGFFDYAGLFPPASLPLENAIAEYARYRVSADKWMIGPFVCHVSSLDDLNAFGHLFEQSPPFRFSILIRPANDSDEFLSVTQEDLDTMHRFVERHAGNVTTDMIEAHVPADSSMNKQKAKSLVSGLRSLEVHSPLVPSSIFLEVSRDEGFADRLKNMASAIVMSEESSEVSSGYSSLPSSTRIGLKLRCGGMDRLDFPTSEQIATFLKTVTRHGVLFKATAGLHHPVRHLDVKSGFVMHGFLNVFFAAALDAVHDIPDHAMIQVLEELDAATFQFSDDGIQWRDLAISTAALAQIRERMASSIGSCSFDEPRADLVSLEWLSPESAIKSGNPTV